MSKRTEQPIIADEQIIELYWQRKVRSCGHNPGQGERKGFMYTREQKEKALAMYDATQSIAEVIRRLGYPSKQALYTWIANRDKPWQKPNGFRGVNTAEHPRHPSVNLKISAIRACFEEGNDVQLISAQIGYSRASIYAWHRRYLKEGML